MTDESDQVIEVPSPGQLLAEARNNASLLVDEIAERMNLKAEVIQAIESDDFDALPNAIFVRGYLKAYARLVNLEPDVVIQAYDRLGGKELDSLDMQSFSRRTSRERSNSRIMWLTYAIALFSLGLVVIWWWQKYQADIEGPQVNPGPVATTQQPLEPTEASTSEKGTSIEPAASASDGELPSLTVEDIVTSTDEPTVEAQDTEEVASQALAAETALAPETISAEPGAGEGEPAIESSEPAAEPEQVLSEVALSFTHDCWIRVEDATGEVVAEGVKTPARVVRFTGVAPFKAIFGLPMAVTVEYQGEPMSFDVMDPKRPLRLTIPKSE